MPYRLIFYTEKIYKWPKPKHSCNARLFNFWICSLFSEDSKLTLCQRKRMDLSQAVRPFGSYIPTCSKDNAYENIQCHPSTGYCWCVDQNGKEWRGTRKSGRPLCDHTGKIHAVVVLASLSKMLLFCCYWCILHRLRITLQYIHSYVWFVLTVELF